MQEPHVEDVANHNDPESCGVCREARAEALTGGNAGQPLSFEIGSRFIAMATAIPAES
jgi:hypothetical protein